MTKCALKVPHNLFGKSAKLVKIFNRTLLQKSSYSVVKTILEDKVWGIEFFFLQVENCLESEGCAMVCNTL